MSNGRLINGLLDVLFVLWVLFAAWAFGFSIGNDYGNKNLPPTSAVTHLPPDPCGLEAVVCDGEEGYVALVAPSVPEESDRQTQLESLIRSMAREVGYPEERAVSMAWCESSMNKFAANPVSSAKGLFQFTDGTWREINASGHQFDAEENIKQFLIWDQVHPDWFECE